uniref:Uncharacterized protein n=1 Tax=Glossina austeni TaxID=7395 RepID=A0A1A9USI6_GLOAU
MVSRFVLMIFTINLLEQRDNPSNPDVKDLNCAVPIFQLILWISSSSHSDSILVLLWLSFITMLLHYSSIVDLFQLYSNPILLTVMKSKTAAVTVTARAGCATIAQLQLLALIGFHLNNM